MLAKHGYPDDLRTVVVVDFIDQIIEHRDAVLLRKERFFANQALNVTLSDSLCHFVIAAQRIGELHLMRRLALDLEQREARYDGCDALCS